MSIYPAVNTEARKVKREDGGEWGRGRALERGNPRTQVPYKESCEKQEEGDLKWGGGRERKKRRNKRLKGNILFPLCVGGGSKSNYATWSNNDSPPPQVAKTILKTP